MVAIPAPAAKMVSLYALFDTASLYSTLPTVLIVLPTSLAASLSPKIWNLFMLTFLLKRERMLKIFLLRCQSLKNLWLSSLRFPPKSHNNQRTRNQLRANPRLMMNLKRAPADALPGTMAAIPACVMMLANLELAPDDSASSLVSPSV